jgi:hypothetical protein
MTEQFKNSDGLEIWYQVRQFDDRGKVFGPTPHWVSRASYKSVFTVTTIGVERRVARTGPGVFWFRDYAPALDKFIELTREARDSLEVDYRKRNADLVDAVLARMNMVPPPRPGSIDPDRYMNIKLD